MPRYDYNCRNCGIFEIVQSITEDALTECPYCGGDVERLISGSVNVIFKGSGFYTTEYRSKDYMKKLKEEDRKGSKIANEKKRSEEKSRKDGTAAG